MAIKLNATVDQKIQIVAIRTCLLQAEMAVVLRLAHLPASFRPGCAQGGVVRVLADQLIGDVRRAALHLPAADAVTGVVLNPRPQAVVRQHDGAMRPQVYSHPGERSVVGVRVGERATDEVSH